MVRVSQNERWRGCFFFSSRRRHTRLQGDWSSDVCSSDLVAPEGIKIEVECDRPEQVSVALDAGADVIMLDNMGLTDLSQAVRLVDGRAVTEADRKSVV